MVIWRLSDEIIVSFAVVSVVLIMIDIAALITQIIIDFNVILFS